MLQVKEPAKMRGVEEGRRAREEKGEGGKEREGEREGERGGGGEERRIQSREVYVYTIKSLLA